MNVVAAARLAPYLLETDVLVTIICDTGERYLTKHHSDEWLQEKGFLEPEKITLGMVLQMKAQHSNSPMLAAAAPEMTVREALFLMNEQGFSQLPVISEGISAGSLRDNRLMAAVLADRGLLDRPVSQIMEGSFPTLPHTADVSRAVRELKDARALLVEDYGRISGILTRHDLLEFA